MSDQSTGSAGREEGTPDDRPSYDEEHFSSDAAGPSIDAPPMPPPPPPPPSVSSIGLPDIVPAIGSDDAPASSGEDAVHSGPGDAAESEGGEVSDPPPSDSASGSGVDSDGDAAGEEVPWQVPNPTPPWSDQSAVSPDPASVATTAPPPPPPPPPPAATPPPPAGAAGGLPDPPAAVPPPPPIAPAAAVPAAPPVPAADPVPPRPPASAYTPSPQGYSQPGGYPQMGYPPAPQVPDPHGVGNALGRISPAAQYAGRPGATVLAAILDDGDVVDLLIQGQVRGLPGVAALVGSKLVLVNAREWEPEVVTLPITATLQVQGMQQTNVATLVFTDGETQEMVDQIGDAQLAVAMAERVRARVATAGQ